VDAGVALMESYDPVLATQLELAEARISELEAKLDLQRFSEKVQADLTRQELARETANYDRLLERTERLVARSGVKGTFTIDRPNDLPGRFVRKGQLVGYITHDARRMVRVVVTQDDVDLVRSRLVRAEVRLAEHPDDVYPAIVVREVPMAQEQLPSAALSTEGGGVIAADPRDQKGSKGLSSTFQFDLELPANTPHVTYGGRAYVRFALEPEELMQQAYRRIRQAFLARFHV
jgi:putative peptide zinc metalloprotease protein